MDGRTDRFSFHSPPPPIKSFLPTNTLVNISFYFSLTRWFGHNSHILKIFYYFSEPQSVSAGFIFSRGGWRRPAKLISFPRQVPFWMFYPYETCQFRLQAYFHFLCDAKQAGQPPPPQLFTSTQQSRAGAAFNSWSNDLKRRQSVCETSGTVKRRRKHLLTVFRMSSRNAASSFLLQKYFCNYLHYWQFFPTISFCSKSNFLRKVFFPAEILSIKHYFSTLDFFLLSLKLIFSRNFQKLRLRPVKGDFKQIVRQTSRLTSHKFWTMMLQCEQLSHCYILTHRTRKRVLIPSSPH